MSDISPEEQSENAKLKSSIREHIEYIEYLEKEVLRLKMLLAGEDIMMNSFSTPRDSK